jgi:nicotinamidase-related amidase
VSFTALDPKTALVVIDLQNGIVALPAAHPMADVIRNARALADAFRARGLPVVLVNVAGVPPGRAEQARRLGEFPPEWIELIPELDRQPQDYLVTKHTPGAFTKTDLESHLRSLSVTQVIVVGVATSQGVEVTTRQAFELGFNVSLPTDAMTDMQADAHAWSTTRVFPRISETGTTDELLALIERTF